MTKAQTGQYDSIRIQARKYYLQALQYKTGNGVTMDYFRAFDYFTKAADLDDPQAVYASGYMYYKGLGCKQDYVKAANLFSQGAFAERDNSMYFYGLCWRNGYGVQLNKDSAIYWLQKSASTGYRQAVDELKMLRAENINDSLAKIVQNLHNAALPDKKLPNTFLKLRQGIPDRSLIAGRYSGYIIQYDWSGKKIVSYKKLILDLIAESNGLSGRWIEQGTDSVEIRALLSNDSISFAGSRYKRRDHYSPDIAICYDFSTARLSLVQKDDTIFMAGNVEMFSPDRGEPSKPLTVVLKRTVKASPIKRIASVLRAYPNPFSSQVKLSFGLEKETMVEIQLLGVNGVCFYRKPAQLLQPGEYLFSLQPGNLAHGTYIINLVTGDGQQQATVIKM